VIKLIIFDMDGVLVDACEWHRVALNESLKEICNYEIPLEDHYTEFNGIPTKIKLKKLNQMGIISKDLFEKIENLKQKKTIDIINELAVQQQEKIELMEYLKLKDIKIACYTNSIRLTAELMLKKTGIFDYLDLLVTNQDVKNPKTDPEGYIKCMKSFNMESKKTLIAEDSEKGLQAAIASGANILKVLNSKEVNIEKIKGLL
jgi:HAD superfamily hydrolase (TIGR01509 family)